MKHSTFLFLCISLLLLIPHCGYSQNKIIIEDQFEAPAIQTLPTPVIEVAISTDGGKSMRVLIYCEVTDAEIYYTIDGTDPTKDSFLYNEAFGGRNDVVTIKAIAMKEGYNNSPIAKYTHYGSGIADEQMSYKVISQKYISLTGSVLEIPQQGVNIVITTFEDGSRKVTKKLYFP